MNVFVSFAPSDEAVAVELANLLRGHGLEVADPTRDLAAGDNLALAVGMALERADAMVVLLTPRSIDSHQVNSDINLALTSRRFKNRLIAALWGVDPAAIPWILRELGPVDLEAGLAAAAGKIAARLLSTLQPA